MQFGVLKIVGVLCLIQWVVALNGEAMGPDMGGLYENHTSIHSKAN